MAVIEIAKIQVRRGQELQTGIPQLDPGEFAWAQDTQRLYIGKRISEGANTDENTRVLTQTDLENIFNLINTTSSSVLTYQYRQDVPYISTWSVVRPVNSKLDDSVNLTDFGVIAGTSGTDITSELSLAISKIFDNDDPDAVVDARRALKLPAGEYVVSQGIELPPYTTLIGEGAGLTKIVYASTTEPMFKTVDAAGNDFDTGMLSGYQRAHSIEIKGMTFSYTSTSASNFALLNLDNAADVVIEDVHFQTKPISTSTTTYGLVSQGVGISIRGTGGGVGSGDVNLCENILINRCKFDSLYTAVNTTGSVIRPVIKDSVFSNLDRGIVMETIDSTPAPSNGYFINNRFENIVRQGIFVGTSTNQSNHISENNYFIQVGNGLTLDDSTSTAANSVISFYSEGNRSINDYFYRQVLAHTNTATSFYYNPLVQGLGSIENGLIFTSTVFASTASDVGVFSFNGSEQMLSVQYKMSDNNYSRKGNLLINVSADGGVSLGDNFNFSYVSTVTDSVFTVDSTTRAAKNYFILKCQNPNTSTFNLAYQVSTFL